MIPSTLPYDEQKTLETICRHHGVEDSALIKDLATFGNWIHQTEVAKLSFGVAQPPFLIVLLSLMGIHGKAALDG